MRQERRECPSRSASLEVGPLLSTIMGYLALATAAAMLALVVASSPAYAANVAIQVRGFSQSADFFFFLLSFPLFSSISLLLSLFFSPFLPPSLSRVMQHTASRGSCSLSLSPPAF